jgi:hypothetical protein
MRLRLDVETRAKDQTSYGARSENRTRVCACIEEHGDPASAEKKPRTQSIRCRYDHSSPWSVKQQRQEDKAIGNCNRRVGARNFNGDAGANGDRE